MAITGCVHDTSYKKRAERLGQVVQGACRTAEGVMGGRRGIGRETLSDGLPRCARAQPENVPSPTLKIPLRQLHKINNLPTKPSKM
jgi:hypothetical protein